VSLAVFKFIPGWLAVIVISRDVVIMVGFAIFSINNIVVKRKPSLVSKCTTVIQLLTAFLVLLNPKIIGAFYMKWPLFWSVAVLTILSGLHYMYICLNIFQEDAKNNQGGK
jgi:cardiolipin synthase|tara:strand:- start:13 stop:345 length:333 start_codon:yes stop_codon:yes gene_type:complete